MQPADPGKLNVRRTKKRAKDMINKGEGNPLPSMAEKKRKREKGEQKVIQRQMRLLQEMEEFGEAICMNLLEKSGLTSDRVLRDLNILEDSVREAAHHLNADELRPDLDRHFGLDNLKESELNKQADGCTIAALLMMNAAMLHQRIANGRWLSGVNDLEAVKNDVNVVRRINREWNQIMYHDFRPVLEPAVNAIQAVEDTGKLAGLERALRHIAAEAERIAESYADMGADHAGPLFNRVMGNQASDGAYFTRPVAASIAARLTLDACGEQDWSDPRRMEGIQDGGLGLRQRHPAGGHAHRHEEKGPGAGGRYRPARRASEARSRGDHQGSGHQSRSLCSWPPPS